MGVLTHRLHGSITALAALAALSAPSELYNDKSFLRSFFNATGQTLLSSSLYAPIAASSFDFEFNLSNKPSIAPVGCGKPPFGTSAHITPFAPFTSQSSSFRFYRAEPMMSPRNVGSQGVVRPLRESFHSSSILPSICKYSPLMVLDAWSAHTSPSAVSLAHLRNIHRKYPLIAPRWHAQINARHHAAADLPVPRFPQNIHFERLFSLLHGGNVNLPMASTALLHMWHSPVKSLDSDEREKQLVKNEPSVAVVLLGWLGAEHRHLKRYADWYTSRGIHAVSFVVPMKDLLTLKAGDRAEKHVDVLTRNLVQWLEGDASEGNERIVIFHTFSNTGWLTYGAVLERLIGQGDELLERIKGCVVDSAPSARPDPHVWASGFSAALLKKGSVATQMLQSCGVDDWNGVADYPKPSFKETALLTMLENFFSVFLQIPYVHRRLNEVVAVLANQQPTCPQLYIYSSADIVIPAKSVESFIEEQKKAGHMVQACNFQCSPHVDHFRTFPEKYSEQLTSFLKLCVPQWAAQ